MEPHESYPEPEIDVLDQDSSDQNTEIPNKNRQLQDVEKVQKEILWSLFQEYRIHARHIEIIRANVANYMLVVASALITVITFDKRINRFDLPLSILVCAIGLSGVLFSFLYFNQYAKYVTRAQKILTEIDRLFFTNQSQKTLHDLRKEAAIHRHEELDQAILGKALFLSKKTVRTTHLFWVLLPVVIFLVGSLLIFLSIVEVAASNT